MKRAFNPEAVCQVLRYGISKGYWTIETLDNPSPGFKMNLAVRHQEFATGYHGVRHKNLLRDQ